MAKRFIAVRNNLAAMLAYILGPFAIISGLFFYVTEEKDRLVWFHGLQAVFFSIAWFMAMIILLGIRLFAPPLMRTVISYLWVITWIVFVVTWLKLMINAYRGKFFLLPLTGRLALENSLPPGEGGEGGEGGPPEAEKGRRARKPAGSQGRSGASSARRGRRRPRPAAARKEVREEGRS